jgi:hypothetical protein
MAAGEGGQLHRAVASCPPGAGRTTVGQGPPFEQEPRQLGRDLHGWDAVEAEPAARVVRHGRRQITTVAEDPEGLRARLQHHQIVHVHDGTGAGRSAFVARRARGADEVR